MLEKARRIMCYGIVYIISPSLYDKIMTRIVVNKKPRPFTRVIEEMGKNRTIALKGAEIGIYAGKNMVDILNRVHCRQLIGVDIEEHKNLRKNIRRYIKRTNIMITSSEQASKKIDDLSLDFVYIDADHSFDSVWSDMEHWYPKVKHGGVMGGHDFCNMMDVSNAVLEWCHVYNQPLEIGYPDWWVFKK